MRWFLLFVDGQNLGLLRLVRVLRSHVYLELGEEPVAQARLREHSADRPFHDPFRVRAPEHFLGGGGLEAAHVPGVAVVYFPRHLLPGELHLVGVHHDDEIAHVGVGRERRLVLAAQDVGDFRGHPAEHLSLGVHDVPRLVGRIPGQHLRRFHRADLPLEIKGSYLTGFVGPRQGEKDHRRPLPAGNRGRKVRPGDPILRHLLVEIQSAAGTLVGFPGGKNDYIPQDRLTLRAPDPEVHKYVPGKEQ